MPRVGLQRVVLAFQRSKTAWQLRPRGYRVRIEPNFSCPEIKRYTSRHRWHNYTCRKPSPNLVDRYKYTLMAGQPKYGMEGKAIAHTASCPPCPSHLPLPFYCDVARARRCFSSSILVSTIREQSCDSTHQKRRIDLIDTGNLCDFTVHIIVVNSNNKHSTHLQRRS